MAGHASNSLLLTEKRKTIFHLVTASAPTQQSVIFCGNVERFKCKHYKMMLKNNIQYVEPNKLNSKPKIMS